MNTYSINGIEQGADLPSVLACSQRLRDIIQGCPLSEVQEGLTLSPKGRPTTGNFPDTLCFPIPSLSRALSHCVPWGNFKELEATADQVCRRHKQGLKHIYLQGKLCFWELADPIASTSHLTLLEDEAWGSWLPLLPGSTAAARTLLTDTLSQLDKKDCRPGACRVARTEDDRRT